MEKRQQLLRVRPTAAPAHDAPPVASAYRACCTSVPYLLYQRTVPVVPAYRACCTTVPYPVYPPGPYPNKMQQLLRKRQRRVPKRRFTVNLQGFGQKKKAATCGKKAATFAGTSYCRARTRCTACCISVPCMLYQRTAPVVPPHRTCCTSVPCLLYHRTVPGVPPRTVPKQNAAIVEKKAMPSAKNADTVNLQGFGQKKRQQLVEKRQQLLRVSPTAAPAHDAPPVASAYRACCTSVPYLLYQRTVPVVPAYRTCCTSVPCLLYHRTVPGVPPRTVPKQNAAIVEKKAMPSAKTQIL